MGIPTLISTNTASTDASVSITSNITSTYDEYMFVCTDINPGTDSADFMVQFNVDGQSGFNETITSSVFATYHNESGTDDTTLAYSAGADLAQGTGYQYLIQDGGNGADESGAGILHLFNPASTTYVKHFYGTFTYYHPANYTQQYYIGGYINVTGAIDEISFKINTGTYDGVIQMYGIA